MIDITTIMLAQTDYELNAGGVVIMTISVGLVLALFFFCLFRILRETGDATKR